MKIIHILGDSKYGGAAKSIIRLAQLWGKAGWEAQILTTDPQFQAAAAAAGVRTVPVDCIWRDIRPLQDLIGLYRLWRFLRQGGFTVAHTHTTKAGFVGRLAARLAGVPVVIHTVHGFAFHERSSPAKIAFYTVLETVAGWCCHRIITVSEFHREWAMQLGIAPASKLKAIPNGIPDPPGGPSVSAIRSTLGLGPDDIFLFTPGRVAEEKGLEELVEAMKMLRERGLGNVRLLFAGDGPLLPELRRRVEERGLQENVRFLGFREDISDLLRAADIVALPSWREGLSIALLESMCAGRPIIASTIGSNKEALGARDGQGACGLFVNPGDAPGLAESIEKLVVHPALRDSLGARARGRWQLHYSSERTLAAHERTYQELLRSRGRMDPLAAALPARNSQ